MTKLAPEIFNRSVYLARQSKTRATSTTESLLAHVAEDMTDRLGVINHTFSHVGIIAGEAKLFITALAATGKCAEIETIAPPLGEDLGLQAGSFDALFSLLDLHCVNDVPGYLAQCAMALKPDGLFMCCFFGGDTLIELRDAWLAAEAAQGGASPRVAPMIGLREMGGLLQRAGLALPVADSDRLTLRYANVLALLREIKSIGYANPLVERGKTFTARRMLQSMDEHYPQDSDGRLNATLELFWAMAWKPHDSQPKPKKPGSATHRFEDILNQIDNEK
jgi:SAM-dependent methyltransferase